MPSLTLPMAELAGIVVHSTLFGAYGSIYTRRSGTCSYYLRHRYILHSFRRIVVCFLREREGRSPAHQQVPTIRRHHPVPSDCHRKCLLGQFLVGSGSTPYFC